MGAAQCNATRRDSSHTRFSLLRPGRSSVVNAQLLAGAGPRYRGLEPCATSLSLPLRSPQPSSHPDCPEQRPGMG